MTGSPECAPPLDPVAAGPLALYRARRGAGDLAADPAQAMAAEKLQLLHHALKGYRPQGNGSWRERLGLKRRQQEAAPQGLYIFGAVGRGKSMLMDLFYETAPVAAKRRVHFLEFMLETHEAMHRWRQSNEGDPIPDLARRIAESSWLLCFDEFQVTNIADAMLLGRLFEALFERGVVVIATSNWAPDDLYEGGLQRDRFLPFIALLKERLDILQLDGPTDYRLLRMGDRPVYFSPLGPAATASLEETFALLTDGAPPEPLTLTMQGRRLTLPKAAKSAAFSDFDALCRQPLGSADYLALATHLQSLLIDGVPELTPDLVNETRRFMILVDALYEHGALLVMAADVPLDRLNTDGQAAFEFRRTRSRLSEMQSLAYRRRRHLT
jgi:cell division protein ZapE